MMRSYLPNSPHAVARVVALAALADGHVSRTELGMLEELEAFAGLGLGRPEVQQVLQQLSEDLMATAYAQWGTACHIDADVLQALMAEVTDPDLRRTALDLCVAVARADAHLADAEQSLIAALARSWQIDAPVAP
jgi:hypothetical protein